MENNSSSEQGQSSSIDQRFFELQSLFEMSQLLNASLNLTSILNTLLWTPMGRMMIQRGFVLVTDENDEYSIFAVKGLSRDLIGKQFYVEYSFQNPILVKELDEKECRWKNFFIENKIELLLPIHSTERLVGILALGSKLTKISFTESEIEFLNSLANIAASSIENALNYQKIDHINKQLDKKFQELSTLFAISKELNSTLNLSEISNLLLYSIMGEMTVTKCFVLLKTENGYELSGFKGSAENSELNQMFGQPDVQKWLYQISEPVLIESVYPTDVVKKFKSFGLETVVPMLLNKEPRGVVVLGGKLTKQHFKEEDLEFLLTMCNQAMISIENARLFEETIEKQRIEEELNIAREIQQKLVPSTFPKLDNFSVFGMNLPSRQVGGDYFDIINLDNEHIIFAIADVSGKGVPASILMSNLQASLNSLLYQHADLSAVVGKINDLIYKNTGMDKFITFFCAQVDLKENKMSYVNAGHNPPYLVHKDGNYIALDKGGLILGMMPNVRYDTGYIDIQKGDVFLSFTDGVTEAMNHEEKEFEEWRLVKLLEKAQKYNWDIQQILNNILEELKEFTKGVPQMDDITMLGFKVRDVWK